MTVGHVAAQAAITIGSLPFRPEYSQISHAIMLAVPAVIWPIIVAAAASAGRITFTTRTLRLVLAGFIRLGGCRACVVMLAWHQRQEPAVVRDGENGGMGQGREGRP